MTREFQNKASGALLLALMLYIILDVSHEFTDLLTGIIYPIYVNYYVTTLAIIMLFFGIYSLVVQRKNDYKFKNSFSLVFIGILFTLLNFAKPISSLYLLKNIELRSISSEIEFAEKTITNYLQNISMILGAAILIFVYFILKGSSTNPAPNHPLKRDEETAGVSE